MKQFKEAYDAVVNLEYPFLSGYLVSFLKTDSNTSYLAINTMCVGMHEKNEIRRAGALHMISVHAHFCLLNYPVVAIDSSEELTKFLRHGGHAMISEPVIKAHWNELLQAHLVARINKSGFNSYRQIEKHHQRRFAIGTERMKIFTRDEYRCRICGSSPDDSVHVRIEVHHIKPWEEGGLTLPENLITLCQTCHEGAKIVNREVFNSKIGLGIEEGTGNIFPINYSWSHEQMVSYKSLLSNTVSFEIKAKSGKKIRPTTQRF